jgi:hypothetical protein
VTTKREAKKKKFDPEGSGYDYEGAKEAGVTPDKTGHYGSRDPRTGKILKGRKHKTFHKTRRGEMKAGYKIHKADDGRYYSTKNPIKQRYTKGAKYGN